MGENNYKGSLRVVFAAIEALLQPNCWPYWMDDTIARPMSLTRAAHTGS
jgi:hypothetical protein